MRDSLFAAATAGAVPKKVTKPHEPVRVATTIDCATHRFDATIQLTGPDGKPQAKAVRMCGKKGDSNADGSQR